MTLLGSDFVDKVLSLKKMFLLFHFRLFLNLLGVGYLFFLFSLRKSSNCENN